MNLQKYGILTFCDKQYLFFSNEIHSITESCGYESKPFWTFSRALLMPSLVDLNTRQWSWMVLSLREYDTENHTEKT